MEAFLGTRWGRRNRHKEMECTNLQFFFVLFVVVRISFRIGSKIGGRWEREMYENKYYFEFRIGFRLRLGLA